MFELKSCSSMLLYSVLYLLCRRQYIMRRLGGDKTQRGSMIPPLFQFITVLGKATDDMLMTCCIHEDAMPLQLQAPTSIHAGFQQNFPMSHQGYTQPLRLTAVSDEDLLPELLDGDITLHLGGKRRHLPQSSQSTYRASSGSMAGLLFCRFACFFETWRGSNSSSPPSAISSSLASSYTMGCFRFLILTAAQSMKFRARAQIGFENHILKTCQDPPICYM